MPLIRIDVVAGIIFNDDQSQILLSLRKPEQHQGDCWEFPGGKIESSESIKQALLRELDEELGIQVTQCEPYCQIEHEYVEKCVHLHFWQIFGFDGKPRGRENQQLDWFVLAALAELKFPDANKPVVARLLGTSLGAL